MCVPEVTVSPLLQEHLGRLAGAEGRVREEREALHATEEAVTEREERVKEREEEMKEKEDRMRKREEVVKERERRLAGRERRVEEREEEVGAMERLACEARSALSACVDREVGWRLREEEGQVRVGEEQLAASVKENRRLRSSFETLQHSNSALKAQVSRPGPCCCRCQTGWLRSGAGGF